MPSSRRDAGLDLARPVAGGPGGDVRAARDAALARAGWTRRFEAAPPRLDEVKALYESLGLEVLLDGVSPDELPEGCGGCSLAPALFRVVYTRRRPAGGARIGGER